MKDQLTDRPKCSAHLLSRDRATLRGIFFCLAFIYLYSSNNMIAK